MDTTPGGRTRMMMITSDMKIRGGGVKLVKKIANVDEVPA